MDKTSIMIEFRATADTFDIDAFSNELGITPSKSWIKGEARKNSIIPYQFTSWGINSEYTESYDMNEEITKVITLLYGKCDSLLELKKKYSIEYSVCAIIRIYDKQPPEMCMKENVIKFLGKINASFDIDLYIN